MPSFEEGTTYQLQEDLVIGALKSRKGELGWYARIYVKREKQVRWRSLNMPYLSGKPKERLEATKAAQKQYTSIIDLAKRGIKTSKSIKILTVIDEYLDYYHNRALKNQEKIDKGLEPVFEIAGTNSQRNHRFYSIDKYKALTPIIGKIGRVREFFESYGNEEIIHIKERQLNRYSEFIKEKYNSLAPSTIARDIVQIRMIWRYARDVKEYVETIPSRH